MVDPLTAWWQSSREIVLTQLRNDMIYRTYAILSSREIVWQLISIELMPVCTHELKRHGDVLAHLCFCILYHVSCLYNTICIMCIAGISTHVCSCMLYSRIIRHNHLLANWCLVATSWIAYVKIYWAAGFDVWSARWWLYTCMYAQYMLQISTNL